LPEDKSIDVVKASIRKNKISVSFRGNAIRVSPNVYNNEADMIKLVKAVIGK
jgi:selenocysteine lyase/cysteine desulfurase